MGFEQREDGSIILKRRPLVERLNSIDWEEVQALVQAERQRCIKDGCRWCRASRTLKREQVKSPYTFQADYIEWRHPVKWEGRSGFVKCDMNDTHERVYQEGLKDG